MGKGDVKQGKRRIATHRSSRHEFELFDRFEAGLVLKGTEVKSARAGNVSLDESFVRLDGDEAFWVGGTIREYAHGNVMNHVPNRKRKLLLRRSELRRLKIGVQQKGLTIVPLELYVSPRNILKLEIALARGRKLHDKREKEKKKMAVKEMRDR
jgi:SsrA-binding protein